MLIAVANYNDNNVAIIETDGWTVLRTVAVGSEPIGAAAAPDNSFIAVPNNGDGTVSIIETTGWTVTHTITVGSNPIGAAAAPDSSFIAVPNDGDGTVSIIETTGWTVTHTITVGSCPYPCAIAPDGSFIAVPNLADGTVSIIETTGWTVTHTITVGTEPVWSAISPDGSFVAIANDSDGTVSIIETTGWTVAHTVTVGTGPYGVAVSPDGSAVAVANDGDGAVSIIETTGWTVTHTITVGAEPLGTAFAPDGSFIAVSNYGDGTVSIIKTSDWTVTHTITVEGGIGGSLWGLGVLDLYPPTDGVWTFELCDQVDVSLADITHLVTAVISPRLNRPFAVPFAAAADQDVWKTIHTDGDRYLSEGIRTIKGYRNGDFIANLEIWRLDYVGDENNQTVVITCFDSMVRTAGRSVRDDDGRISDWQFSDPLHAGPFVKELFANSITYDDDNVPDGTPRIFPIDAVSGDFTADCDVTNDYADGPMTLGDLIYRTICDVGLADIMLTPTDTAHGSDPGIYGILHCVTHWGTDKSTAVHFDYATGENNVAKARRTFDMATLTNRLRYLLGPKLRPTHWRATLQATDPGLGTTHYRTIQANSRARYGTLRAWEVFSSNTASELKELYRSLWKVEDELRVNPRQLLYMTPAGNCLFQPFTDYNVGDLVTVNVGDDLGPAFAGVQRIYGFDVTVDVNGVETVGELIVSPDGAAFPPS